MKNPTTAALLCLTLLGLLAACGGGGGGGGGEPVEEIDPPTVTSQPSDSSVTTGETATFTIAATGEGTLAYQWQLRASGAASWTNVSGATSSSYTTPATVLGDDGDEYRCVVTNAGGSTASDAALLEVSDVPPWSHTILIDGANDFMGSESFTAADDGVGGITWDANYLYVGTDTPLLQQARPEDWFVIYLGGTPGTTTGIAIGVQQPALPFAARYCVRYRADGGAIEAFEWGGTSWNAAGWDFTGDWAAEETYFELRIPRIDIGVSSTVEIHLSWVSDFPMEEITTLGVPATTFTRGLDPDYTAYYEFDFLGTTAPDTYAPLP